VRLGLFLGRGLRVVVVGDEVRSCRFIATYRDAAAVGCLCVVIGFAADVAGIALATSGQVEEMARRMGFGMLDAARVAVRRASCRRAGDGIVLARWPRLKPKHARLRACDLFVGVYQVERGQRRTGLCPQSGPVRCQHCRRYAVTVKLDVPRLDRMSWVKQNVVSPKNNARVRAIK